MTDDGPQTIMVPAQRILVVENLGDVRKGDHLIMVANVIVAHDTSRQSLMVATPAPRTLLERRLPKGSVDSITREVVYNVIKEIGPTTAIRISDHLKLARNDTSGRAKVGRMILFLKQSKEIRHQKDPKSKVSTYEIAPII